MNNQTRTHALNSFHLLLLVLFILLSPQVFALDWGLRLNQTFDLEGDSAESKSFAEIFDYSATLIPWVQTPLGTLAGGDLDLYAAAGFTLEYYDYDAYFIPELLRTEISWRLKKNMELKLGRMLYADPLGFIANGLFDGAQFSMEAGANKFALGVWYTGLIFKRNANITMTNEDHDSYVADLDYDDFADTYFAPRRLVAALDWENSGIIDKLILKAAFISQFDLSGRDELYHSQYLAVKAGYSWRDFIFDLGGTLELAEISGTQSTKVKVSMAGEAGAAWKIPNKLNDLLKFSFRFSNGTKTDSHLAAFVPITTVGQGNLLEAKLSGISVLSLDYTARLHKTFAVNASTAYFILTDYRTYKGKPNGRDGHGLGSELYGRAVWSPFSDLQLNLGSGIFLPQLGNAHSSNDVLWRVELYAALAIF